MTTMSQPSRGIYVLDVPEAADLTATFRYNFFTPDESINETGGVPAYALARPADQIDASYVQYAVTRVPRMVTLSFSVPRLADVGSQVSEQALRDATNLGSGAQDGNLILSNIDKVVFEDYLSSNGFVSLNFHDARLAERVHDLVSGSLAQQTMEDEHDGNTSHYRAAQRLKGLLPSDIKSQFLYRSLANPQQAYGATFYAQPSSAGTGAQGALTTTDAAKRVVDPFFERMKAVSVNVQVSSRFLQDMVNRAISDPTAPASGDMATMYKYAKSAKQAVNQTLSPAISESDYRAFIPYVTVRKQNTATQAQRYVSELVGYIIDKYEVLPDGTTKAHPPIVVESPFATSTADFQVKFNTTYCYTVRAVALMTLQAIDDDNGDVATLQVLVSSKPCNKVYVDTLELDAPPTPADIDFTWDYEANQLMVCWAFPVTSQRDIKQFQVFRRGGTDEPFQLQKVYDFDDSVVRFPARENPDPRLVERLTSPCSFYVDPDFDWNVNTSQQKALIYAVAAIDAHGLTSPLSAQFQVWFDRWQNRLQLRLVSHAGSPKAYPNLYLDGDAFVDTVKVKGPNSKQLKLYFNPEYYYLYDAQDRYVPVLATAQDGGGYVLQFINLDSGKGQSMDIVIDNLINASSATDAPPQQVRFGPRRMAQQSNLTGG